jgi:putative tricarboxylic transport membrane protein
MSIKFLSTALITSALAIGLITTAGNAAAAEPKGPIMIVIPAAPGGANDRLARGIKNALEKEKIITNDIAVKNQDGGGGAVAWAAINRHPGDMTQISTSMSNLLTNDLLEASPIGYKDVTPIATFVFDNACYAVNPKDPDINSAETLITALKNKPETLRVGFAPAVGNHWHIGFAALAEALGADYSKTRYTAFASGGKANTALLGGHINLQVVAFGVIAKFHQSGDLKCVALASEARTGGLGADIPTWRELGVDLVYTPWRGVVGPVGLKPDQIAFWEEKLKAMTESNEWKRIAEQEGYETRFIGHEGTMKLLESERVLYLNALTKLGLLKK